MSLSSAIATAAACFRLVARTAFDIDVVVIVVTTDLCKSSPRSVLLARISLLGEASCRVDLGLPAATVFIITLRVGVDLCFATAAIFAL